MSMEYPSDEQLEAIKRWPGTDPLGWFACIRGAGNYWPDWGWLETRGRDTILGRSAATFFHISTGGWSGNEDILGAMRDNVVLWMLTWSETRRGGHFVFEVRDSEGIR